MDSIARSDLEEDILIRIQPRHDMGMEKQLLKHVEEQHEKDNDGVEEQREQRPVRQRRRPARYREVQHQEAVEVPRRGRKERQRPLRWLPPEGIKLEE